MSAHKPPSAVNGPSDDHAMLDAYLDHALDVTEQARFEAIMAADAGLSAEVAHTRAIEESLRRCFAPPGVPNIITPITAGAIGPQTAGARRPRWLPWGAAIAAVLAVAVGIQYGVFNRGAPSATPVHIVRGDAGACMRSIEEAGYKPEWVCKDDAELARYTRERFGAPWKIDQPEGLRLVGWTYTGMLLNDHYASVLLAEYQGRRLVLVVHHKMFDRDVKAPPDGSLFAHRAVIGDQVVYELSPFEQPVILGRITAE